MRKIKYKAWDNDKKEMAKIVAMDWAEDGSISTCHLKYKDGHIEKKYPNKEYGNDIELLRYIKDDINDNEMYEGSIVTSDEYPFQDEGKYNYHGILFWDDEDLIFVVEYYLINKDKAGISHGMCTNLYEYENLEVIGNKYENPELLENIE